MASTWASRQLVSPGPRTTRGQQTLHSKQTQTRLLCCCCCCSSSSFFCSRAMAKVRGSPVRRPSRLRASLQLVVASAAVVLGCNTGLALPSFSGPAAPAASPPPLTRRAGTAADVAIAEVAVDASFQALSQTPVRRASDGAEVALPSLWSQGDRVVVAFLRHFG